MNKTTEAQKTQAGGAPSTGRTSSLGATTRAPDLEGEAPVHADPTATELAAKAATEKGLTGYRRQVLEYIRHRGRLGVTGWDLSRAFPNRTESSARTRLTELRDRFDLVCMTKYVRENGRGNPEAVWMLKELAQPHEIVEKKPKSKSGPETTEDSGQSRTETCGHEAELRRLRQDLKILRDTVKRVGWLLDEYRTGPKVSPVTIIRARARLTQGLAMTSCDGAVT